MSDSLVLALALFLVIEGLLPLLAPQSWRELFMQVLRLSNGQIRFFGLLMVGMGLLLYTVLSV